MFALTLLLGVVSAAAQPARLALIPSLVDRAALPSALAINAVIFDRARFLGRRWPGVIDRVSVGAAFAVNATSYIGSDRDGAPARPAGIAGRRDASPLKASVEAYTYASRHPGIAPMLLLFLVTTIGARGFVELFPGFADRVFGRGPKACRC